MIFTELRFLLMFLGCAICFFLAPVRWREPVLAAWGLLFYSLYAGWFLPVVLALTLSAWWSDRRGAAWAGGAAIVALLVYYKRNAGPAPVTPTLIPPAGVLIPLGFSYLSFELLHVIIDKRRGRIGQCSLAGLLAYVFFAPARVAGPIRRFPAFSAEVRAATPSGDHVCAGVLRILLGLAKKFFIADILALTVAEAAYAESARQAWFVMVAYGLQIYFDFSAYSDIAIGFARTLGIRLPENFNYPYFAPNIREFWDRWHITLSHWVRDYVFLPAGQRLFRTPLRRQPSVIAALSYLVTFLVVGAWHGLSAGYLVWGGYHAGLLASHHVIRLRTPAFIADHRLYRSRASALVGMAITFVVVTIGWVPFMLPLAGARKLLGLMLGMGR